MTSNIKRIENLIYTKKYKKALIQLQKQNSTPKNRTLRTLGLESECLLILRNWKKAIIKLNESLNIAKENTDKVKLLSQIARSEIKLNERIKAIKSLKKSLKIDSSVKNIEARLMLCQVAHELGYFETIEKFAPSLLCLSKYFVTAQFLLCESAIKRLNKKLAVERLSRLSLELSNLTPPQISFILHSFIQLGELKRSKSFLEQTSGKFGNEKWHALFNGLIHYEENDFEIAIELLKPLDHSSLPDWFVETPILYQTLGKAYESLEKYTEAYNNFTLMGKLTKEKWASHKRYDLIKSFKKLDLSNFPKFDFKEKNNDPVFMLGFPRSGTTLLEQALDSHPNITTLSEQQTLTAIVESIAKDNIEYYPKLLANISLNHAESLRQEYFSSVNELTNNTTNIVVDKLPIYSIHLPLINTLFPNAKIILSIRHPMDVILSNFQQYYAPNNEMSFLTTIDDCLDRYLSVFNFIEENQTQLKFNIITTKYEDLVNDMESEIFNIFSFLGVQRSDTYKNFYLNAQQKILNTSSRSQVIKPLYQTSKYKWLNYKSQLEPYKHLLNKYIEKYGYGI